MRAERRRYLVSTSPVAAAGLALALAHNAVAAAANFEPGKWEHATALSPDGQYWLPENRTQGCLTTAQAGDPDQSVRQQLAAVGCTAVTLSIANGRIAAELACGGAERTRVTVTGRYTHRSYDLDFRSDGAVDLSALGGIPGLPFRVVGHSSGRRLGPC